MTDAAGAGGSAIDLRAPTPADAPALAEAVHESVDDLRPWLPWAHPGYGVEDALAFVEQTSAERGRGDSHEFLIVRDGAILGVCGLNRISHASRMANLGYWVRSSAAGRGVAPEAVRRLAAWGFEYTALHRLEVVVAVENGRSQRVAEKAGARREGVLRARLWLYEVPHDAVMYGIVRTRS